MRERAASILGDLDADTRSILERYRFDEDRFLALQTAVADGTLSPASNFVSGDIEPPAPDDVEQLPAAGSDAHEEARAAGLYALRRGEVAVAVLNGGMATRFGGAVKGIVEVSGGRSFLEWKLLDVQRVRATLGADVPFVAMNSFATDEPTREFVARRGLPEPLSFAQSVSLRLNADGSLFRDDDGTASPYAPGHGDFVESIRATGTLVELRSRGVRVLMLSNVDNLGARPDPVVIGVHLLRRRPLTLELAPNAGDVGGAPARVDGKLFLVEGFRFPPSFDARRLPVVGTNTHTFDLDALDATYPLTWLYVEKNVAGRPAVQLECLVNELSAFLPTTYLEVPREGPQSRFLPIKTPADLEAAREPLREMLATAVV